MSNQTTGDQGAGIAATIRRLERWLEGWPNGALTVALLLAAGILVYVALRGRALEKAVVAAWVFFP